MGANLSVPSVDLSGKVAVVTGGNTGIGYEIVKGLAEMGAHTFMACRSEERATSAIMRMKQTAGAQKELNVEFLPLDLASFQSTKEFVRLFKEKNLPLHILINNAAVAWVPFSKTDDGFEIQYQVNHLSALLLTLELVPNVLETAASTGDGRILFVSSGAHRGYGAAFNPDNLNYEIEYDRTKSYPNTKLYNVLTTYALQRRLQNVSVTVSAQEPGYVKTELNRGWSDKSVVTFFNNIGYAVIARTPKEGAATILNCAVNPELKSQEAFYYASCKQVLSSPDSRNEQYQEELWKRSIAVLRDHLSPEVLEKYGPPVSTEKKEEEGTIAAEPAEGVESKEVEKEGEEVTVVNEESSQPEVTLQATELEVEVHVDAEPTKGVESKEGDKEGEVEGTADEPEEGVESNEGEKEGEEVDVVSKEPAQPEVPPQPTELEVEVHVDVDVEDGTKEQQEEIQPIENPDSKQQEDPTEDNKENEQ